MAYTNPCKKNPRWDVRRYLSNKQPLWFRGWWDKFGLTNEKKCKEQIFAETWHIGYTEDISICVPLLGKRSITLSFIMGCEKCDWTSVEKETELWRDGSQLGVINIFYGAGSDRDGRLMDASIISAAGPTLWTWLYVCFTVQSATHPHLHRTSIVCSAVMSRDSRCSCTKMWHTCN